MSNSENKRNVGGNENDPRRQISRSERGCHDHLTRAEYEAQSDMCFYTALLRERGTRQNFDANNDDRLDTCALAMGWRLSDSIENSNRLDDGDGNGDDDFGNDSAKAEPPSPSGFPAQSAGMHRHFRAFSFRQNALCKILGKPRERRFCDNRHGACRRARRRATRHDARHRLRKRHGIRACDLLNEKSTRRAQPTFCRIKKTPRVRSAGTPRARPRRIAHGAYGPARHLPAHHSRFAHRIGTSPGLNASRTPRAKHFSLFFGVDKPCGNEHSSRLPSFFQSGRSVSSKAGKKITTNPAGTNFFSFSQIQKVNTNPYVIRNGTAAR